jgi:hypothetical protein
MVLAQLPAIFISPRYPITSLLSFLIILPRPEAISYWFLVIRWRGTMFFFYIHPAIYYVIPAAAKRRAGIQPKLQFQWIPAFAGMTEKWSKGALFNCNPIISPIGKLKNEVTIYPNN